MDWSTYQPREITVLPMQVPQYRTSLKDPAAGHSRAGKIGRILADRYLIDESELLEVRLKRFLDICWTLDRVKIRTIGQNAQTAFSNATMASTGHAWVASREWTRADLALLDTFTEYSRKAGYPIDWLYPKAFHLRNAISLKLNALILSGIHHKLPGLASVFEMAAQQIEALKGYTDEMFDALKRFRDYGVKSSYFHDGLMQPKGNAWVMLDPASLRGNNNPNILPQRQSALCSTGLAKKDSITNLKGSYVEEGGGSYNLLQYQIGADLWLLMDLDTKGELQLTSDGLLSVREVFMKADSVLEYEMLRMLTVQRLYDLVVPVEAVNQTPRSTVDSVGAVSRILSIGSAKKVRRAFDPRLIIPRLRLLEQEGLLVEMLEAELVEAERETRQLVAIREHDVVDFTRKLPKGYKASPEANQRFMELYGRELPEGRTFVRSHVRGSAPRDDRPHRAVQRK